MSLLAENPPSTKIVADCRHGNLRCHLWRQSWHHDDARFSVVSFPVTPWPRQGALTRYPRLLVARAPGMPGTFSPPPTSKKTLVSDPGIHHGTCATHLPWCMSGSLTRGVGENVPGIPGAWATRNFAYLIRGPLERPFWNSLCTWRVEPWNVPEGWKLAMLPQSKYYEFNPRIVHGNFSTPLWVLCVSRTRASKLKQHICKSLY